jgi:hypothetical protein
MLYKSHTFFCATDGPPRPNAMSRSASLPPAPEVPGSLGEPPLSPNPLVGEPSNTLREGDEIRETP